MDDNDKSCRCGTQAPETPRPYRLGIALSGGGARGFAHAGALKAIEEVGLKADVVAGVSAGAVAAVLYASGIPGDEMPSRFSSKLGNYTNFSFGEGGGLFSLKKMAKFIEENAGVRNLEELPIPTYIGVTDFDHGVPAEFHEGPLGERVCASCSIPIIFPPVKINGVNYVDGGVLRNLPVWTIRDKCDYVIAINCSPLTQYRYKKSIFDVALRTFNLMTKTNQARDMSMADLVIQTPDISTYQVFNLKDTRKVYLSGYAAAHKVIKEWVAEHPGLLAPRPEQ